MSKLIYFSIQLDVIRKENLHHFKPHIIDHNAKVLLAELVTKLFSVWFQCVSRYENKTYIDITADTFIRFLMYECKEKQMYKLQ